MRYKAYPDDIIITILGPTGSGKTHFIEALSGRVQLSDVGSLEPCTKSVTPYIIPYGGSTRLPGRLVLVDTPGLQEGSCPDAMLLRKIFDQLKAKYSKSGVTPKLAGIIYLHRITDNRINSSPIFRDPHLLGRLCYNTPLRQACLVTTMWDELGRREVGENREKELIDEYWGPLINEGAATKRFNNTSAAAWEIITDLLRQSGQAYQQNSPIEMEGIVEDGVPRCFCF